jgi:hypothetical protein
MQDLKDKRQTTLGLLLMCTEWRPISAKYFSSDFKYYIEAGMRFAQWFSHAAGASLAALGANKVSFCGMDQYVGQQRACRINYTSHTYVWLQRPDN